MEQVCLMRNTRDNSRFWFGVYTSVRNITGRSSVLWHSLPSLLVAFLAPSMVRTWSSLWISVSRSSQDSPVVMGISVKQKHSPESTASTT